MVIYYNAVVPERGVPLVDENEEYSAMIKAAIDASPDGSVSLVPELTPMTVPGGHESMPTHPDEVALALLSV
jgi:hypothetical protein